MNNTFIGLVSDTHRLVRPELLAQLEGASHIVHAGDVGDPAVLTALAGIAPLSAIRGNVDRDAWADELPDELRVTLQGIRFLVTHDRNALSADPGSEGIDVVVSGHSHQPGSEWLDGVLWVNPGSAGPRRFRLPITCARLYLGGSRPVVEHVELVA